MGIIDLEKTQKRIKAELVVIIANELKAVEEDQVKIQQKVQFEMCHR